MQIKRKRKDGSSRRKNIIRIVLLLIGSIGLIILFNIINEKDEFTSFGAGYTKTDGGGEGTMLRGELSLNENIHSAINNDQNQRQYVHSDIAKVEAQDIKQKQDVVDASDLHETTLQSEVDIEQVIQPEQDIKSEQEIQPEISPLSLLHSPDAIKNLPPCEAIRHDLSTSPNTIQVTSQIAIFTNWSPSAINKWGNRTQFQSTFGNHQQYIKGKDVQPLTDMNGDQCKAKTTTLLDAMFTLSTTTNTAQKNEMDLLFFTNNKEHPSFLEALSSDYSIPSPIESIDSFSNGNGFQVFSAMEKGSSHPFHSHDAAWLGQISGSRLWYFLPPDTPKSVVGEKVNGCDYLLGRVPLPMGVTTCIQNTGEVMYFPPKWIHATCALEPWSVGIGGQGGSPNVYDQNFVVLDQLDETTEVEEQQKLIECGVLDEKKDVQSSKSPINTEEKGKPSIEDEVDDKEWKWFGGDIGAYYDKLEADEHAKRDPNVITSYAVHRWMGPDYSTLIHYELIRQAIYELVLGKIAPSSESPSTSNDTVLRLFDAGCGLGPGLMWFEQHEPAWELVGHTISEDQHKWIINDLPKHKFEAKLLTYDEPLEDGSVPPFNGVYSIEAAIHSPNLRTSLQAWSKALLPGGVIVLIDDFLSVGVPKDDPDVELFAKSWLATSIFTTTEISNWADEMDMSLVRDLDLGSMYQIVKRNYRNKNPVLRDEQGREHQGWLGSKVRQKLLIEGKITYRLIVLKKKGETKKINDAAVRTCDEVPSVANNNDQNSTLSITIDPVLMTGRGKKGGEQMACISSWYCCDKGQLLFDELEQQRTEKTGYLQLPRDLFGHYLTSFSKHLTDFYRTYPPNYPNSAQQGIFLDIGGTGSTASGMKQVTSKFSHWAGPLDYWVLDSDAKAKELSNAVVCDIDNCPEAPDCGYDVTFSHTVLEHAARPWESFDTIARITKKGGLTLHLVPWSYQYHATPSDNYRFSHTALRILLEDRGFEVLDVGYDICTQPEHMLKNKKDEHFEKIWLTYVVGRKL